MKKTSLTQSSSAPKVPPQLCVLKSARSECILEVQELMQRIYIKGQGVIQNQRYGSSVQVSTKSMPLVGTETCASKLNAFLKSRKRNSCEGNQCDEASFTQDAGRDAQCNASKRDLLSSMGVFTLHARNIKGLALESVCVSRPRVLCE